QSLRVDRGPWLALAIDEYMDQLLIVPEELAGRRDRAEQLADFFQQFGLPFDPLARRKAFAGEVPFLAEHLPGHDVLGLLLDAASEFLETGHCFLQKFPEPRVVDLDQ